MNLPAWHSGRLRLTCNQDLMKTRWFESDSRLKRLALKSKEVASQRNVVSPWFQTNS